MNCCNKGFTSYWRKAASIKQQQKNKSKRMAERGISIFKENWWNIDNAHYYKVGEKIVLKITGSEVQGGMYDNVKLSVVN